MFESWPRRPDARARAGNDHHYCSGIRIGDEIMVDKPSQIQKTRAAFPARGEAAFCNKNVVDKIRPKR
jgi:hypothetical protein